MTDEPLVTTEPIEAGESIEGAVGVDRAGNPCSPLGYNCYNATADDMPGADSMSRWDADALDRESAGLIREQWDQYKEMYTPIMGTLNARLGDKDAANRQAEVSRGRGLAAGTAAKGQALRDVSRYGIGMTGNQRDQFHNTMDLSATAGGVQGSNRARESMYDHRLAVMSDMAAAGHGVQGSAMSGLRTATANAQATAGQLAGQVQSAQAAKAARNSQMAGAALSAAAMVML